MEQKGKVPYMFNLRNFDSGTKQIHIHSKCIETVKRTILLTVPYSPLVGNAFCRITTINFLVVIARMTFRRNLCKVNSTTLLPCHFKVNPKYL